MSPERFGYLLHQYKIKALSPHEWEEFTNALNQQEFIDLVGRDFDALLKDAQSQSHTHPRWTPGLQKEIWENIQANKGQKETPVVVMNGGGNKRRWWAAAAVILILILGGFGGYFYFGPPNKNSFPVAKIQNPNFKNDVLPGTSSAVLTLANGKTILLDSASNGLLARQDQSTVLSQHGTLIYQSLGLPETLLYNTLTTNKGEQYPLTLSDGTKVWLNAASSIRFPVVFAKNERRVEISGEAYFEVVHDPAKPFHVIAGSMDVEDLGTHFDINAYTDEGPFRTSLLEGSVRVNKYLLVQAGQQSQFTSPAQIKLVQNPDLEGAVAWKNGLFHFKKVDISTIMRQVERWYDITIIYDGAKTTDQFTGDIPRTATLTELLFILEMAKVHFKLEGKILTVLP
jgi:transmembrane sensor